MDGVIEDAAKPLRGWHDPESSFDQRLKEEVAGELSDVAPVAFIAERESVVKGDESRSPGQVRNGGVLISLGPVRGAGKRVKVGCNGWVDGKAGLWLTYVLERSGDAWEIAGTTGPMTIS